MKRSAAGVKAKAKRAVRAVLVGAAAGAIVGAVRAAVQAGGKELGLRSATDGGKERAAAPARKSAQRKRASAGAPARRGSR